MRSFWQQRGFWSLSARERMGLLGAFMILLCSSIALQRSRIQVWLYEQVNMRIEGCIIVSTRISLALPFNRVFFRLIQLFWSRKTSLGGWGWGWKYFTLLQ